MTSKALAGKTAAVLVLVAMATGGCLGKVQEDTSGGGDIPGVDEDGGTSPSTSSQPDGSVVNVITPVPVGPGQAESAGPADVIISSDDVDQDGAIASDGTNVYWTVLDDAGVYDLMACLVLGCSGSGPSTLATNVYAGSVVGEIVAIGGIVYFQTAEGDIVDCPSSGCRAAGPTLFVKANGEDGNASLTTDGASLFWQDDGSVFSCSLGARCMAPFHVSTSGPLRQIVTQGDTLYWVDDQGNLASAPIGGGSPTPLCTVSLTASGLIGQGSLAVRGAYAYVSAGLQPAGDEGGIYECPIAGGSPSLYASDPSAIYVQSDGESIFWLSGDPSGMAQILNCAPGVSCTSPTTFVPATQHLEGFALEGSFLYSVSARIQRTVKM